MSQEPGQPMFCYAHPQRETLLRCNRCDRPMCTTCAVRTPTGYRCKECVRGQQKIFDTALWWDYPVAILVGGGLAFLGSLLVRFIGFFTLFLAPFAGMIIAEAIRRALHKRRSKWIPMTSAIATLGGALFPSLINLIVVLLIAPQAGLSSLLGLLWPAIFAVVAASTAYYRLKGIRV